MKLILAANNKRGCETITLLAGLAAAKTAIADVAPQDNSLQWIGRQPDNGISVFDKQSKAAQGATSGWTDLITYQKTT